MLSSLFVSDLALIHRLSVDFDRGFSVFTGETGAGKSLILDSLQLFLSGKGGKELVRHGAPRLEVSLFFHQISPEAKKLLSEFLDEAEIEEGITLSRSVEKEGKSRCQLNGRTLPFSKISQIARLLLSVHGQHDAGGLLDEKRHRFYLDEALEKKHPEIAAEFASAWEEYSRVKKEYEALEQLFAEAKEMLPLWDYQMKEIAKVKPRRGEEEALEEKLKALTGSEKERKRLYTANRALTGGEKGKGAIFLLDAAARNLEELGEEHPLFPLAGEISRMSERLSDAARDTSLALSDLGEGDPQEEIDRIHRRIDLLYRLKLKYGETLDQVISYFEEIKEKKDLTVSRKDDINKAKARLTKAKTHLEEKALLLSRAREKISRELEEEIHGTLSFLDMPKMRFFVELTPLPEIGKYGGEDVRFFLSPNAGEGKKPLSQVASGGELSRVMLALQLKLSTGKDADTMIFDEVDTGVSGATAQKIGICMKCLSEKKQIFCVTHSAQVSSLADQHFRVFKKEEAGRTETLLSLLSSEEALSETARLLGGKDVSQKARQAAEELKTEGEKEYERQRRFFQ